MLIENPIEEKEPFLPMTCGQTELSHLKLMMELILTVCLRNNCITILFLNYFLYSFTSAINKQ